MAGQAFPTLIGLRPRLLICPQTRVQVYIALFRSLCIVVFPQAPSSRPGDAAVVKLPAYLLEALTLEHALKIFVVA